MCIIGGQIMKLEIPHLNNVFLKTNIDDNQLYWNSI